MLKLEHIEAQAKEVDEKLGITPEIQTQGRRGKKNKTAMAAGGNQAKIRAIDIEEKKSLSERGCQNQLIAAVNI